MDKKSLKVLLAATLVSGSIISTSAFAEHKPGHKGKQAKAKDGSCGAKKDGSCGGEKKADGSCGAKHDGSCGGVDKAAKEAGSKPVKVEPVNTNTKTKTGI